MANPLHIHKALSDETRLRLVRLLAHGPLNVNEILSIMRMGQSRISRHLRILADAELASRRREGTWIYYQSSLDSDSDLVTHTLELLGQHEREIPHFEEDIQGLEAALESRRRQTRSFFDSVTAPHAVVPGDIDGTFYREVALGLLPERSDTVVDLGTGSGLMVPGLLERADQVIAIDSSSSMLDLACKTAGTGAARCDFRLGDLEHLPVADGEAESVVACMVLHHVSDPASALSEAYRALRPGGEIAIVDLDQHESEIMRGELGDLWLGFRPTEMRRWLCKTGFGITHAEIVIPHSGTEENDTLRLITFRGRKPWERPSPASPRKAKPSRAETGASRTTK
ncbi:MAG: metalloregulator ArsR/SmtB family transcription factor [Candidatus Latescibacterota bacterium]|nr:metalloregulator ArsR/SmtB family transcription factor [Candidatus Latescibacterota bacterium]